MNTNENGSWLHEDSFQRAFLPFSTVSQHGNFNNKPFDLAQLVGGVMHNRR